jgi:four helix bundle protein
MSNNKPYDLEERTSKFAKDIITLVNNCPKTIVNIELMKQLIRSSGSVGANYIEAREALSKKDFALRIKICRKEVKESAYWLRLLEIRGNSLEQKRQSLITESTELLKIFASIVEKVKVTNNKKGDEGFDTCYLAFVTY